MIRPVVALALLLAVLAATMPARALAAPEQRAGFAAHYRPGLMARVSVNRGLPIVPCMIASPFEKIGTWLHVQSTRFGTALVCRVTDVAHPRDRASIIRRGIVVELDFDSARLLCNIQRVAQEPPRACPVIVSPVDTE